MDWRIPLKIRPRECTYLSFSDYYMLTLTDPGPETYEIPSYHITWSLLLAHRMQDLNPRTSNSSYAWYKTMNGGRFFFQGKCILPLYHTQIYFNKHKNSCCEVLFRNVFFFILNVFRIPFLSLFWIRNSVCNVKRNKSNANVAKYARQVNLRGK